jgi:hypothetical protein
MVALLALGSVSPAAAQTATPAPTTPDATNKKPREGAIALIVAKALIDATVTETGVSERDLLKDLYAGKSLNDIIAAKNAKAENVKTAATKTITDQINQAVKDTKLTQAQADVALKNLDNLLDRAMKGEFNGAFRERVQAAAKTAIDRILKKMNGANLLFEQTAKATGISQRDLLAQVRTGKTLAQIAKEKNVEPKTIIDAAVKQATLRLNALVKSGKIKQEDVDKVLATLPADLEKIMNTPNPLDGMGKGKNPGVKPSATPSAPATPSL